MTSDPELKLVIIFTLVLVNLKFFVNDNIINIRYLSLNSFSFNRLCFPPLSSISCVRVAPSTNLLKSAVT